MPLVDDQTKLSRSPKFKRRAILLGGSLLVLIVVGILVAVVMYNTGEQNKLQAQLAASLPGNDSVVAYDATALINGKLDGEYYFGNQLMAQYYMDGATAYYNLMQYHMAETYYAEAPKYDSADKRAALEGQVSAGYAGGERQQLIPLLSQLESMSASGPHDVLMRPPGQYQQDIQDILNNQPVDL